MSAQTSATTYAYVGTYTQSLPHVQAKAEGIYVYRLDPQTGSLTHVHTTPGVINPSFLALHPSGRYLYAVNEVSELDGQIGGGVSAFAVDPRTGALTFLNRQSSRGAGPCHLTVDQTGNYALVANYGGGSTAIFPIESGGLLAPTSDFVQHVGSSVNPQRQRGPHAHSATIDPTSRYALVADLGLDKILLYWIDIAPGRLIPNDPPAASVAPGAGPRHVDFHPNGRFVYVINELGSTITAFSYDAARGHLAEIQTISTLPDGFSEPNFCADVHVHPSGRFVYGSNRGHGSIVAYAIDEETGRLTCIGHEPTQGRTPRNFAIDPTGTFLFAANQDTDTIVTFRIDQETGKLTPTGTVTEAPTPVCVKFLTVSV